MQSIAGALKHCAFIAVILLVAVLPAQEQQSLFEESLSMACKLDPETNADQCRVVYKQLLKTIKDDLASQNIEKPELIIATLNKHLLQKRSVTYISNLYWRDSLFTSALIKKNGNCLSTSLLYCLIAKDLKLPISMALAPRHAYARWDDGKQSFAIETTAGGEILDESILVNLNKVDKMESGYGRNLNDVEMRAVLLCTWGTTFLSINQPDEGFKLIEQGCDLWPDNLDLQLSRLRLREGVIIDVESVRKNCQALLKKVKGEFVRTKIETILSRMDEENRSFDAAIEKINKVMPRLEPGVLPFALEELARLYRHKRDFTSAIALLRVAVAMRPKEESHILSLASAYTEAHRDEEAIQAYEKALTMNDENFFPKVILAGLYERNGERARGRAYFNGIPEPREGRGTWYSALVWYYAVTKRPDLMIDNMEKALALDKTKGTINYYLREPDIDPYHANMRLRKLWRKYLPEKDMPPLKPGAEAVAK